MTSVLIGWEPIAGTVGRCVPEALRDVVGIRAAVRRGRERYRRAAPRVNICPGPALLSRVAPALAGHPL